MNITIAAVFTLLTAAAAVGQVPRQYRAQIPFDFTVNGRDYKAGEYLVRPVNSDSGSLAIALTDRRTGKGRVIGLASALALHNRRNGTLIFSDAGGRYSLLRMDMPTFDLKIRKAAAPLRAGKPAVRPRIVHVAAN